MPLKTLLIFFKKQGGQNAFKSPYGEQGIYSNKNPAQRRNANETQIENQCCK